MKEMIGFVLVMCTCISFACGQEAAGKKPAKGSSGVSEELKQVERDWTEAQKTGDTDKMAQIIADDWAAFGPDGVKMNKQQYLAGFKAGESKFESVELGTMDARVFGTVGVVQGSDIEKSTYKGKDSSGKYVWTDVFQKKDGNWQAVRSQVTKVK